jgi:WD40 repeat protein
MSDDTGEIRSITRGTRPDASPRLLDRFRAGVLNWQKARVDFGLILSGDKLVQSSDFRQQLLKFAPEAIGGEMEGAGLYSAAYRRKVDWIVVKAICDWADKNKQRNKPARQQLAAANAVRFTIHVLRQGGFTKSDSVPPHPDTTPPKSFSRSYERGTLIRTYDIHSGNVIAVDWEPDGTRIASAGADGTVRIWDAETGHTLLTYRGHTRLLSKINLPPTIYFIAWSPEGLRIISSGDGAAIYIWNATTGQTLTQYQKHSGVLSNVFTAVWSPDGKCIASACSNIGMDKTIHIWDALTGNTIKRYPAAYGILPEFSVLSLAWSPDGTRLAATCGDKIWIWNTANDRVISTTRIHTPSASHLVWSPDSTHLASAHPDKTVLLWNTQTGTILTCLGHTDSVRYVAWSPDGTRIASTSNDRTARIWNAITGAHIYTYHGHTDWVTSLAWSPDGTRIASASNDKTVQIWNA